MNWEVSKDGKTVKAGGKTYTRQAFANQFSSIEWKNPVSGSSMYGLSALKAGASGSGARYQGKGVKQVKVSDSPEAAKKKYEKKAAKKVISEMNKKGVGNKLTGKEPKSPAWSSTGKTRIGGLAGGGMFGIKNR